METSRAIAARYFEIPTKYKFLSFLGQGAYARVVKCLVKKTGETVAIKLPTGLHIETEKEISILRKIRRLKLDKHNIVKYIDSFPTSCGTAFVFESLDISLCDYMKKRNNAPMLLSDLRTIIQQMATALQALKKNKLIHTDVKLDNIMIKDHQLRPFEIKLIDFGLAISTSDAFQGMIVQPLALRSPEVTLCAPFSEAIDMWSLGCIIFKMLCGRYPISGATEYDTVLNIVELLGQPDADFLDSCEHTSIYFTSLGYRRWRIKSPFEYYRVYKTRARRRHPFKSLDEMKAMRLEENNPTEAVEREQCIELLKAMLTIHPRGRITPREVLSHPFITKDYLNVQTDVLRTSRNSSEDFEGEPPTAPLREDSSTIQPDGCTTSDVILPSGVILVRPATAENTELLEDQKIPVSFQSVLNNTSESSASDADDNTETSEDSNTETSEDSKTETSEDSNTETSEDSNTETSEDSNTETSADSNTSEDTETKKTGRKRKNCFRCIRSWFKKRFSCRVSPID